MTPPIAFREESLLADVRQSAEKRIGSISLSRGWPTSGGASIDALAIPYMVVQTRCGRVPRLRVNPLDCRCFFRTGALSSSRFRGDYGQAKRSYFGGARRARDTCGMRGSRG